MNKLALFIFSMLLILLVLPNAEASEDTVDGLQNLIDEQFKSLQALDSSAKHLVSEKKILDEKLSAYGQDYKEWYEAGEVYGEYIHYTKRVFADFNEKCKGTTPLSEVCAREKKFLDNYDYLKAQEFYKKLVAEKMDLDARRKEIMGAPQGENEDWTIGALGQNSAAGWEYLEKRKVIVERIISLQKKIANIQKNYIPAKIPNPLWSLQ